MVRQSGPPPGYCVQPYRYWHRRTRKKPSNMTTWCSQDLKGAETCAWEAHRELDGDVSYAKQRWPHPRVKPPRPLLYGDASYGVEHPLVGHSCRRKLHSAC
eukprot:4504753-Pyramimonas_sp.AAC.1